MRSLYLPALTAGPTTAHPGDHADNAFVFAYELLTLMRNDSAQERSTITVAPVLKEVAIFRANDMVRRNYYSHTDPDGFGPNYHTRRFGYKLPSWYSRAPDANNVESIAADAATPDGIWRRFLDSPGHRAHLLGELAFYAAQVYVGIGVAVQPNGRYRVCIISAPGEE